MANYFDGIVIGGKSWFMQLYLSGHVFKVGQNHVIPRESRLSGYKSYVDSMQCDYPGCAAAWSGHTGCPET
jgi:hypothetical protein